MRAKCICFSRMLLWKIRYDLSLLLWPFQLAGSTSLSWLGWWEISSWVIESSPMGLVGHHYAKGSIGCKWFWVFWSDSWDSQRLSWWFILAYYAITCFLCASEIRYLLVIADSYLRTGILSSAIVMICFGLFGLLLVLLCCTYGVWLLVHSVCSPYVLISFLSSSPFAWLD